ncbi:MAG: PAS domain S-box protein [bacterium]|jgi:PAS domain S-box-containing protein|nr:PAS domain S-box protein [candidate division KSB1 bacterium]MDH7559368.1 PAS domain S-box protein [bacterium]
MAHTAVTVVGPADENQHLVVLARTHAEGDLFRELVEGIADVVLRLSAQGVVEYCSPAIRKFAGYLPEEVVGRKVREYFADDREFKRAAAVLTRTVRTGGEAVFEFSLKAKDRAPLPVEVAVRAAGEAPRAESLLCVLRAISARKEKRAALQESEAKFRAITENLEVGIFRTSAGSNGRVLEANPALVAMFGFPSREELIGKRVQDLYIDPADREALLARLRSEGVVKRAEVPFRRYDGTRMWCSLTAVAERDRQGRVRYYDGMLEDITARKLAELSLRESEGRLRQVTEQVHAWVWEVDATGRYTYTNLLVSQVLGYTPEELVGKKYLGDLLYATKRPEYERSLLRLFDARAPMHDFVVPLRHKDGHMRWLLRNATPVFDKSGAFVGYQGADIDITERHQQEEQIRQQRSYLQALIEHNPLAIAAMDREGKVTLCNGAFERLFQYERAEMMGQSVDALLANAEQLDEAQELTRRVIAGERVHAVRRRCRKDGTEVDVELFGVPVMIQGAHYGAFVIYQDITQRKRAEEELVSSLKEKELLLKEIHHRVKNNMQVISSLLSLQSSYISDPRALAIFNDSQNRVKSMALIHEKLYQSKNLSRVDFAEYTKSLTSHLFDSYGVDPERITMDVQVNGIDLAIDSGISCGLIVNELVSNALKHAFPDGRKGKVTVGLERANGSYVLKVSDDGVGFPAHVDFRNTESLGLQLVNTLTDQLEGTIELSANGGGTTFTICFPDGTKRR